MADLRKSPVLARALGECADTFAALDVINAAESKLLWDAGTYTPALVEALSHLRMARQTLLAAKVRGTLAWLEFEVEFARGEKPWEVKGA
jgi:hypothetical protein